MDSRASTAPLPSAPRTADLSLNADVLAEKSMAGEELSREEALGVLEWPDQDILTLMQAAYKVRHAAFGKKVRLNYLVNIQSGICPEDCGYCSQSSISDVPVDKYKLMTPEEVER